MAILDLTIRTPRIELRYPTDDLLPAVTAVAAAGIHPPDEMPFSIPWTRKPAGDLERGVAQFIWSRRTTLTSDDWGLPFIVLEAGRPIGIQELFAKYFPVARTVETGSWLTRTAQGRGIGLEMRAAVLHSRSRGCELSKRSAAPTPTTPDPKPSVARPATHPTAATSSSENSDQRA